MDLLVIRAGDVPIPFDAAGKARPSWRKTIGLYDGDPAYPAQQTGRAGVLLTCICGEESIMRSIHVRSDGTFGHDIDAEGTVSPSINCTHCCGWHVFGRLLSWPQP